MDPTFRNPGRRIYIHATTLRLFALQQYDIAEWVTRVLARIRATRVVHHHLIEQAMQFGLLNSNTANHAYKPFENAWKEDLTNLLRQVGYRPSTPRDRSVFLALIESDEQIVASCFDQGYYTFATTEAAADRMFADSDPISELNRSLRAGSGPFDLVLISGRSLALIDPRIGVGAVGRHYAHQLSHRQLEPIELDTIDSRTRAELLVTSQAYLDRVRQNLSDSTEQRLLDSCIRSLAITLNDRGSL